jgi:serine protease AprX
MRRSPMLCGLTASITIATVTGLPAVAGASDAPDAPGSARMVVHEGHIGPGAAVTQTQREVTATVLRTPERDKPAAAEPARPSKLHPKLAAARTDAAAAAARQRVIVTFQEDQKIPRLPDPDATKSRAAAVNVQALARADAVIADIEARRQPRYQRLRSELGQLDVRTLETFWLIKGVVADAPLAALPALARRPDVRYVEPVATGAPPPADSDPANDVEDARARMRTDPYFDLGQTAGYIGLLDTGVRANHVLFNNPSHLDFQEDLTNTTNPNPDDDCWNHGTSSAAIITGNSNLGFAFRGVTGITLDSFKVYPSGCGGLDAAAAVNGFQRAVQVLDRVIVAEMQAGGNELSSISAAADAAYDAGAVVIAANGNNGPTAGTVNSPGNAQKALGIGAVDVKSLATPDYQSRGPAADGRIKPDLQAPTNVETASSASTTATQVFTGTSAATPHAAGAAALVRNFLGGTVGPVDPGQVYAYMFASGSVAYPFNNTTGAGLVRLLVDGVFWRGQTSVGNGQTVEIPLSVAATSNRMNVAIWWPEAPATHNDIDVSLVDPSGVVRASSISIPSVFERVSVAGPLAGGTWKVRIRGYSVPGGSQTVHWTAATAP